MYQAMDKVSHKHLAMWSICFRFTFPHAPVFSQSECSVLASVSVVQIRGAIDCLPWHARQSKSSFLCQCQTSINNHLGVIFVLGHNTSQIPVLRRAACSLVRSSSQTAMSFSL